MEIQLDWKKERISSRYCSRTERVHLIWVHARIVVGISVEAILTYRDGCAVLVLVI